MQVVVILVVVAAVAVGGYFLVRRSRAGQPGPGPVPPEPTVPERPAAASADNPGPKPVAAQPGPAPAPVPAPNPSLAEADKLYASSFADPKSQDRTQWEQLRALYTAALAGLSEPAARKPVVDKLNELNKFLIFSSMKTADSVVHKVEPTESYEKIALAHDLSRDCANSLYWLNNKIKSIDLRAGASVKVIKPLRMEIRVSKKHLRLTAILNGYFFGEFPVGIGKDDATPAGEFVIKTKDRNPNWTKTVDGRKVVIEYGKPENILGTRWMGFEDKPDVGATGLGIHGTTDDTSVPGRVSAGCVRMHNPDVELLYDFTSDGTKVTIAE